MRRGEGEKKVEQHTEIRGRSDSETGRQSKKAVIQVNRESIKAIYMPEKKEKCRNERQQNVLVPDIGVKGRVRGNGNVWWG